LHSLASHPQASTFVDTLAAAKLPVKLGVPPISDHAITPQDRRDVDVRADFVISPF
jgi:hypothetical protein